MRTADLPTWPAMMDLELAAGYCTLSEDGFKALMARNGVRPVDLGTSNLRWRKADIDGALDRLPLRPAKSRPYAPQDAPPQAEVIQLVDPALAGLENVRKRVRR